MAEAFGDITQHAVDQWSDLSQLRAQQLTVKLSDAALEEDAIGRAHYFDQVGKTEMTEDNTRHAPSPHNEVEHFRRKTVPRKFHWGHNIDPFDRVQMLNNPAGKYVLASSGAYARTHDSIHINALGGSAIAEDADGNTTTITLPTTQKVGIQVGGSGDVNLNEHKVREALGILTSNEVDIDLPENKLYGVIPGLGFYRGLMSQDKFVSSDYKINKPLDGSQQMTFDWMGVTWIVTERVPFDSGSTTDRKCYVWAKSGLGRAKWSGVVHQSAKRADLSFDDYLYMRAYLNCVRLEEEKVVEIMIDQTASAT